jgi:RND family efflux transporter MFP subunit
MRKFMNTVPWPARLVAALLVAALVPHGAQAQGKKKDRGPILVVVDAVVSQPLNQTFPVIGRLVARRTGLVAARIGGAVAKMNVDVGDRVSKGDVVASLITDSLQWDRRLGQAEVAEAEAAVKTAGAQITLLAQELKRLERLRKSAAFSQARYDDKRQEVAKAKSVEAEAAASLLRYRANLKLKEIALYDAAIRAPYGGVVTNRLTEVGSYLKAGDPVIALIDDSSLEIEADVPSARIAALVPGTTVTGDIDGASPITATVRAVVPEENPLTRTRPVRFTPTFANGHANLAVNQSVTLSIPLGRGGDVVTVHKDAVINRRGKSLVFVVKDGTAEKRVVKLGEAVGSRFQVLDGLVPGDSVVIRGNERLRPGQKVRTKAP